MRSAAQLCLASEPDDAEAVPSVKELYTQVFEKGWLPEDVNRELLWAAVNPEAYAKWAHARLDRAGVPREHHHFEHDQVVKMVKNMFKPSKPK